MKKLLLVFLLISTASMFADAGNGYRFYLQLLSKEKDTINGYYLYTEEKITNYHDYHHEGFINLIFKDTITIYPYITTVSLGEINVDFTTVKYKKKVALKDCNRIFIMEFLDFGPFDRLIELKEDEFELIEMHPPMFEKLYNENVAENCSYILMSWHKKSSLTKFANELNEKLVIYGKDIMKNQYVFHDYLTFKKEEYLQNKTLLINYCVPL